MYPAIVRRNVVSLSKMNEKNSQNKFKKLATL